ncbi:hypothetical protein DFS33DRAFT_1400174 [Desarmillaria ectypa]|nr:hypothetical protein DFS33DRAFT_1400174 [Desarmillaria ectypa]
MPRSLKGPANRTSKHPRLLSPGKEAVTKKKPPRARSRVRSVDSTWHRCLLIEVVREGPSADLEHTRDIAKVRSWKKYDILEKGSTQALNKNNTAYAKLRKREGVRKWILDVSTKGPIFTYDISITLYREHAIMPDRRIIPSSPILSRKEDVNLWEQGRGLQGPTMYSESYSRLMGGRNDRRSKAVARSRIMICFEKGRIMKC